MISRLLSVGFSKKGREYSIILDGFDPAYRDCASDNDAPGALDALQIRVIGPNILVHGSDVSVSPDLCIWNADEVEMVEWGENYCGEAAKTVAYRLGDFTCTARTPPRIGRPDRRIPPRGWVVVWPRG